MARDFSAYEREMDKAKARDSRRSQGGGSDYVWLSTDKPSRKGDQTKKRLRIVPRPDGNGGNHEEFWMTIDQHMVTVDGRTRALVCPDNHDDPKSQKACPLCKMSRELYASRNPEYLGTAKELSTRLRVFANVIDLDDDQHPGEPKVWGFSRTIQQQILDICMAKRSFIEDLEEGRDLILTTRRIGPKRFDIRYAITDMDTSALQEEFIETAKAAHDLEGLAKPATLDELHEIAASTDPRTGSKRVTYTPDPVTPSVEPKAEASVTPAPPALEAAEAGPWHYSGADGQEEGLTAEAVAKLVKRSPSATHSVWKDGMSDWADAAEVPEVATLLAPKKRSAPPPPKKGKKGPPAPPTPREGSAF